VSDPEARGIRIPLEFSRLFADRKNVWMLLELGDGVRIRTDIGGAELTKDVELRWRMPAERRPDAVFVRPVDADGETWLTEPFALSPILLKVQLHMRRCPRLIADALRRL